MLPAYPEEAEMRIIDVSSPDQAKKVIDNHVRFLELLFEQSRDPYYGELKWSKKCLADNIIGKRVEKDGVVSSTSTLYLNANGRPGHCTGVMHVFALVYCPGSSIVIETKFPVSETVYEPQNMCQ